MWSYTARKPKDLTVLPDGCRDFILRTSPGKRPIFLVTSLMSSAETVFAAPGDQFHGFRLLPGAEIDIRTLELMPRPESKEELTVIAREAAFLTPRTEEILSRLAVAHSPADAARELGVSLRTMQRHTVRATGRTPCFWSSLSRARRAARLILSGTPLGGVSHECLFSDQAHMTRELRRWFSMTPGAFAESRRDRCSPGWRVLDPGYDAPSTGEQSSTR